MNKKVKFNNLMAGLAKHYRVDGGLTADFINDYWIHLCAFTIDQVEAGMQEYKGTTDNPFFPNIVLIKRAVLKVVDQSEQLRLPPPNESVTDWQRLNNKLNWDWFNLFFGYRFKRDISFTIEECILCGPIGIDRIMVKGSDGRYRRPADDIFQTPDNDPVANIKQRNLYVQSKTPNESPYKINQGTLNV